MSTPQTCLPKNLKMNLIKLLSTDFCHRSNLVLRKSGLLDILKFLIRNPRKKSLRLAGAHEGLQLIHAIFKYTKASIGETIDKLSIA